MRKIVILMLEASPKLLVGQLGYHDLSRLGVVVSACDWHPAGPRFDSWCWLQVIYVVSCQSRDKYKVTYKLNLELPCAGHICIWDTISYSRYKRACARMCDRVRECVRKKYMQYVLM